MPLGNKAGLTQVEEGGADGVVAHAGGEGDGAVARQRVCLQAEGGREGRRIRSGKRSRVVDGLRGAARAEACRPTCRLQDAYAQQAHWNASCGCVMLCMHAHACGARGGASRHSPLPCRLGARVEAWAW